MRKYCVIFAFCAVLLCAGCAGETAENPTGGSSTDEETGSLAVDTTADTNEDSGTSISLADLSYVDILPKWADYFPDGEDNVIDSDGGKMYCIQITGVTDEQAKAYLEACRELDFKHGPGTWNTEGMEDFLTNPDAEDAGALRYETDTSWHYEAYSGDKQFVTIIGMDTENGIVTITAKYKGGESE